MKFGTFDDSAREYVITRPDTPLPWINYLGCEAYFGLISNTAGGYSFYKDARLRRLTRYRYNNAPLDMGGRYLYLRDNNTGTYWSPTWMPTRVDLDEYECRHGQGYTIITSQFNGIKSSARYFVPLRESLEIWQVTLTNQNESDVDLSLFSAIEFCLWDANDDATNFQRNYSIGQVEIVDDVIYHKTEYRERRDHFAYFACSEKLAGFETIREDFLGAYRGWDEPCVVETGKSVNTEAHGWQPIGSHHVKIYLKAGESKQIIFILGYQENSKDDKFDPPGSQVINKKSAKKTLEKYLQPAHADKVFEELHEYWTELLGKLQVSTPDEHTNRMLNISATQLKNGGAFHQYQPLTKRGNNDVGSGFNDDPLWLVLGVSAYVKETGDWSILDEEVQYENEAGTECPLYEHLQRAVQYTLERLGPHNLPLIGRADWNDCLNLNCFSDTHGQSFQTTTNKEGKVAESVFIAGLFMVACQEMAGIAKHRGDDIGVEKLTKASAEMEKTVWAAGWDGDWFRRAYDDFGHVLGSKENSEGRIFIEPQGICVMAGLGVENGNAVKALDSVAEHLATPHGIVLQQPAFSQYYLHLGEISSYPPGYKENAGIFCHSNPWIMIAEAMVGRGEQAFDYYTRINPSAREEISELHKCEPYVYAQMIAGKDAATHGEAKNSWLTGTAAWNYVAITQYILGIRPAFDGLEVKPVLPSDWNGFEATRSFRGVRYEISVVREGTGNSVTLEVNGKSIDGTVISLPNKETKIVKVKAV